MAIPVVLSDNGLGLPVRAVESGAPSMTVAPNGFGIPIVISDNGTPFVVGGLAPAWVPDGAAWAYNYGTDEGWNATQAFTRASSKLALDPSDDGYDQFATDAIARFDGYWAVLETALTELGNYTTMDGAVVGVIGSGGALPTGWTETAQANGVTLEVVAIGTQRGVPTIDVRFSGTPSANWRFRPTAMAGLTVSPSTQYIVSTFMALVGGAISQADDVRFGVAWYNSGNLLASNFINIGALLTADLDRHDSTVMSPATANQANLDLNFSSTSGEPIDFTLRFAVPNMGADSKVSSPVLSNGAQTDRAADASQITPEQSGTYNIKVRYHDDSEATLASGVSTFPYNPLSALTDPRVKLIWGEAA